MNEFTELRQTRVSLEDFFEFVPDAIVVVNREGYIVEINTQAEKMFGYSKDEVLGKSADIFILERFREIYMDYLRGYITSTRIHPECEGLELYGRKKDGSEFPVDIALGSLETEKGIVLVNLIRDITEHKQMEETMRESEMRFRSVVQSAIDAIILADRDGNIISWNKGAKIIFGYTEEEILGKPLTIFFIFSPFQSIFRVRFLRISYSMSLMSVQTFGILYLHQTSSHR